MNNLSSFLTDKATVLHQSDNEIRFQVDNVKPCEKPLSTIDARSKFEDTMGAELLACSHDSSLHVVSGCGVARNKLVNAVHLAFSEHRPLVFTPDIIWLTLAQGFAHHINNHAEALRSRFVTHKGKKPVVVEVEELTCTKHWVNAIEQWSTAIAEHVGSALNDLLMCDFSTTTPVVRTASQVVMMDAFQEYFDYHLMCICGIPSVTLKGSLEDWERIRERVDIMEEYHLEWWTDRLKPICDALLETAKGVPSLTFWRHIYKPKEVYGGEEITGWLADLFPYVNDPVANTPTLRNRILSIPREQLTVADGLRPKSVPTGLSQAPFTLTCVPTLEKHELNLVAGFMGVVHDSKTGALQPEIGWAIIKKDPFLKLLDDMVSKETSVSGNETSTSLMGNHAFVMGMPKEVICLAQRFAGTYTFFPESDHPWHLKAISDFTTCEISGGKPPTTGAIHFMNLGDGRGVVYVPVWQNRHTAWWIVVGKLADKVFQSEGSKVVATGMLQLFERMASNQGRYYFDDPNFVAPISL